MRRAPYVLLLLLACAMIGRGEAFAQRLGLSNLVVDNQDGRVKVRFGVEVKALDLVQTALASGQVLALECRASLDRKRDYVWNSQVASAESLSPLTLLQNGVFEITSVPGSSRSYRGRDLALVMKDAWGAMSLDLGGWGILERGRAYSLTLEIRVARQDVSGWLKGALFFWNFDALPPIKYQLDFSY